MPLSHIWSDHDIVATVIGVCGIIWTASTWTISYYKAHRDCALLKQAKETNRLLRKLVGEDEPTANDEPPRDNPSEPHQSVGSSHIPSIASRATRSIVDIVTGAFRHIGEGFLVVFILFYATITCPSPTPSPPRRSDTIHASSRPGSPLQSADPVIPPSPVLSARVLSVGSNASRRRSHKSASEFDV